MTDTITNTATTNLITSVQETNKAIADSAVTTQEGTLAFAQSVLENGIEVLRSHAESARTLMQELVERARKQHVGPETLQVLMDSAIAAQERNTKLARSILESGVEVLKSQINVTRSLAQELGQQFQVQQDAFQTLAQESMDAYKDFIFAPLTFWQKALSAAESASLEGFQEFQKATQQGLEIFQKTSRQAASMTEKALQHPQPAGQKSAH